MNKNSLYSTLTQQTYPNNIQGHMLHCSRIQKNKCFCSADTEGQQTNSKSYRHQQNLKTMLDTFRHQQKQFLLKIDATKISKQ